MITGKYYTLKHPGDTEINHVDAHGVFKPTDYMLMDSAFRVSMCSKAKRKWVGAIIAKNGRPIVNGYNGTSPGTSNVCEVNNKTLTRVIHAEQNALNFCARFGLSIEGCTLYTTCCPCEMCAASIGVTGIKRVVFFEDYKFDDGKRELLKNNIEVIQMLPNEQLYMLDVWKREMNKHGVGQ